MGRALADHVEREIRIPAGDAALAGNVTIPAGAASPAGIRISRSS